jgi:hypothetical protein
LIRPKLLYFITEDWFFCSHRLPLALAAQDDGYDVAVVKLFVGLVSDSSPSILLVGARIYYQKKA